MSDTEATKTTEPTISAETDVDLFARVQLRKDADKKRAGSKKEAAKQRRSALDEVNRSCDALKVVYDQETARLNQERHEIDQAYNDEVARIDREWREALGIETRDTEETLPVYSGPWYDYDGNRDEYGYYDAHGVRRR